jgi:5-methylcytosine-specific restriction endonuclease McrA
MARYHSDPEFRDQVLASAHLRRADRLGADVGLDIRTKRDLVAYLIKRDKGRCGICHKPVRAKKGPMRPSVDHIIPLSVSRDHSLANLQLAHYRCNLSKNNRAGGEQLLLVG